MVEDQQTSPDEVMKALKRYLKESTETEHAVAVLIGVNPPIRNRTRTYSV